MLRHICGAMVVAGLLLGGCASHPALDPTRTAAVLEGPVPPGKARIYVFTGTTYSDSLWVGSLIGSVVSIDGIKVARIGPYEAVAVDVPRGHHVVSRNLISLSGDSADAITLDPGGVAEGEQIYIGVDSLIGRGDSPPLMMALHPSQHPPAQDPGDYLDLRDDGPEMLQNRTLVTPDPAAVAQLNKPKESSSGRPTK